MRLHHVWNEGLVIALGTRQLLCLLEVIPVHVHSPPHPVQRYIGAVLASLPLHHLLMNNLLVISEIFQVGERLATLGAVVVLQPIMNTVHVAGEAGGFELLSANLAGLSVKFHVDGLHVSFEVGRKAGSEIAQRTLEVFQLRVDRLHVFPQVRRSVGSVLAVLAPVLSIGINRVTPSNKQEMAQFVTVECQLIHRRWPSFIQSVSYQLINTSWPSITNTCGLSQPNPNPNQTLILPNLTLILT